MNRTFKSVIGASGLRLFTGLLTAACSTAAAQKFPIYEDGGSYTNSASLTTENELLINNGSSLLINSNAVVQVGSINMDEPSDNMLEITDDAVVYAGTTDFTTTNGSSLVIGDGDDALLMDNGSLLTAENFYMGVSSNDTANIELAGDGTELTVENATFGTSGTDNEISISDGATFTVADTLIIGSETSSNNYIYVDDEGTLWVSSLTNIVNNSDDEEDNTINIEDGGTLEVGGDMKISQLDDKGIVLDDDAFVAVNGSLLSQTIGNYDDTGLNIVLNTSNSTWNASSGNSYLGKTDSDNSLTLTNGGSVAVSTLQIGYGSSADNNELIITTDGSLAATNLVIGRKGDYNSVSVTNGTIYSEGVIIGKDDGADNNSLIVQEDALVTIDGDLTIGDSGSDNFYEQTGGTNLISGSVVLGVTEDAEGNNATIGTNSYFEAQSLTVGDEGAENWFKVADGGYAHILSDVIIGASTNGNYIELSGSTNSSLLQVDGSMTIGLDGEENYLEITSGTASIAGDILVGVTNGSNYISLSSTNALLDVGGSLFIGYASSNNYMTIENGATAVVYNAYVGSTNSLEASSNNTITITGSESLLAVSNELYVGSAGSTNNSVTIEDGGILKVASQSSVYIAEDNFVYVNDGGTFSAGDWDYYIETNALTNIVFDTGSTLEVAGTYTGTAQVQDSRTIALNGLHTGGTATWDTGSRSLYIGSNSVNNALVVRSDALATTDADLILGYTSAADGNSLIVTGESARVEIAGTLRLGRKGSDNRVEILDGGSLSAKSVKMGTQSAGSDNSFFMAGGSNQTAALHVTQDMYIGQFSSGNSFEAYSNTTVNVGRDLIIGYSTNASGNSFYMAGSNAVLTVDEDLIVGLEGSENTFTLSSNVTASIAGDLIVGTSNAADNAVIIDGDFTTVSVGGQLVISAYTNTSANSVFVGGSNTVLTVSDDILLGLFGNGNSFTITNGAAVTALSDLYLGGTNKNNTLSIGGTNSSLTVEGSVVMGSTAVDKDNLFGVYDEAFVSILNNFTMNSGELEIHNARVDVNGNYTQKENATLSIIISEDYTGTNLVVGGTASFAEDTSLSINRDSTVPNYIEGDETNEIVRTIVAAGDLKIDGKTATTDLLYSELNIIENALVSYELTVSNNTIVLDNFSTRSLSSSAGVSGSLAEIADAIEALEAAGSDTAEAMMDIFQDGMSSSEMADALDNYYGEKQSSIPAHNVINLGLSSVAEQLTRRADTTRARMGGASASIDWDKPEGTEGPHQSNQLLQGWINGYSSWGSQDAADGFGGYDADLYGFMVGADFAAADNVLFGLAGGKGSGSIDKDNGGSADTDSIYGSVYGSIGTKDWFADAAFIYGASSVEAELGSTFNTEAEYDAQNFAFYVGGGKEIIGDYFIFTPQVSLLANFYEQDGYTEEASNAVGREVDDFSTVYLQSSLGGSLGMYMGMGDLVLKPEISAYWLHQWNADDEDIDFKLIGTSTTYSMLLQAPEKDIFKIGMGASTKLGEFLELRADLDTRFSGNYSDLSLLGSLRYQF